MSPLPLRQWLPRARCSLLAFHCLVALSLFSPATPSQGATDLGNVGNFPRWSKVEIAFTGPSSAGMSETPNPFTTEVDVIFSGPNAESFTVPGFYDGDGVGGLDGDVWKVRFSPNAVGAWTFSSSAPAEPLLHEVTGSFDVTSLPACPPLAPGSLPDLSCSGRLEYASAHHLRFSEGDWFL